MLSLLFMSSFTPPFVYAASHLSLDEFLNQVKNKNSGVQAALTSSYGAELRSEEGKLLLAPTFFANTQFTWDAKYPPARFLLFSNQFIHSSSFGISQLTTFGMEAKLRYDIYYQTYNNPRPLFTIPGAPSVILTSYAVASPVLELTQSLWGNGFGRSTRANQELAESNALASSYGSKFEARTVLSQAETQYWNLAVARQAVAVQEAALDRAKRIYQYNVRKSRLHLGESSDVLQAEALVQSRELELASARNDERKARRAFNSSRHIDSEEVVENLIEMKPSLIDEIPLPERAAMRDDVKAAEQSARARRASAVISAERDSPTLEAFATLALNGQGEEDIYGSIGQSIGASFSFRRPTESVGVRFRMPLDQSLINKAHEGWKKEQIAAEKSYDQKVFDSEQSWKDLTESLKEAKAHLSLSRKLEEIQRQKLEAERKRLNQGRTTTYQVLLFEQDFLLSQLNRIRDQSRALTLIAQMKLFGELI
jgi:outer membrane protein TolC